LAWCGPRQTARHFGNHIEEIRVYDPGELARKVAAAFLSGGLKAGRQAE
jgi:hypothetical protein